MRHEWEQILDLVAAGCHSERAKRYLHDLPSLTREEAERELRAVTEAGTLFDAGVKIFSFDLDRVGTILDRFDHDEPLEGIDYRVIAEFLEQVRLAKVAVGRQTWVKEIALRFEGWEPDLSLEMTIKQARDKKGEVSSEASPELARIRRLLTETHARIAREIKRMIQDPATEGMLQEDYFTIRDDRYVLPFKTQFKRIVKGVIHNFSRSGQTAFLEPLPLVEENNRLSLLAAEEDAEIRKVLRELRGLLSRKRQSVAEAMRRALHLESLYARNRWMRDYACAIPEFASETQGAQVTEAWYPPVFLMTKEKTVRNTFLFKEREHFMVISGPNAGGKTVALKTFYTVAELARRGIPVPAKEARIPFFTEVFLVLGDQQDAAEGESSFSAHLRLLAEITNRADASSLVLVDEIASGTDPQQGGVIARAFLEFLRDRGSFTLVTSHLAEVKALALEDPAFVPVAMGFDEKRGAPTYRFMYHLVGGSNPLALIKQMSFPQAFVATLENLLLGRESSLEPLLNRLREKEQELEERLRLLEKEQAEIERRHAEIEKLRTALARKERDFEKERLAALKKLTELEEAELRRRVETLDAKKAAERIAVVRKEKESLTQAIQRAEAARDETPGIPLSEAEIRPGETVVYDRVTKIKGVLAAVKGKKAEVIAGNKTVSIPIERLIVRDEKVARKVTAAPVATEAGWSERCDVRGMTAEEACAAVEKAVDAAFAAKSMTLLIIHGHGTGALKKAIRAHLETLAKRYPVTVERAPDEQGGDGATLVTFK